MGERGVGRAAEVMGEAGEGELRRPGWRVPGGCFHGPTWTSPLREGVCDGERATGPGTVWDHVWLAGCGGLELHPLRAARADGSDARESLEGDVPRGRGWAGPLTGSCWCRRVQVWPWPQSRFLWVSASIASRGPEKKSDFGRNEVSALEIVRSQPYRED